MVSEMLQRVTGKTPDAATSPDEAVAHGAALYAAMLSRDDHRTEVPACQLINVNSHSLGVVGIEPKTRRRVVKIVIPKNTPLPSRVERSFVTERDDQRNVKVPLTDHSSVLRRLDFVFTRVGQAALDLKLPKPAARRQQAAHEARQQLRVLERKLQDQQQRRKKASDATEAMRLDSTLASTRIAYEQQKRLADFATLVLGRECLHAGFVPPGSESLKDEADELRTTLPG